jgi:uncharacterized membrane protein (DUF373 family)
MAQRTGVARLGKIVLIVERYIIMTLIGLMSLLLITATIQLGYMVIKNILTTQVVNLHFDMLMDLFGLFLLVLIGIELLDTIKVYFKKHEIHVEVVMLVALIAIARKIILMDFGEYSGFEILGIAAVVLALTSGYYFIKRAGGCDFWPKEDAAKALIGTEKQGLEHNIGLGKQDVERRIDVDQS